MARFSFTGEISLNDISSKNPYIKEGKTDGGKGSEYKSFNAAVKSAQNNKAYLELFGMVQKTIKTFDNDPNKANKIEISWGDRFDPEVIKSVAGFRKHVYKGDTDNRSEFIADYDFVEFLASKYDDLKSGKYTITGTTRANVYQGKVTQRFVIQNVYAANEDAVNALKVHDVLYWNKDSVDTSDWKEEKKITINGYVSEYINKDEGTKYIPFTAILDCSKIDFSNEKHMKLLKFKLAGLGLELDGDKVKCKFKNTNYYKQAVEFNYYNGSEEVEFDESMLTDYQREMLNLGLKELKDFRPSGSTFGERKTEYKIVSFDSKGEFEDGLVEVGKASEFEEDIFYPAEEESVKDLEEKKETMKVPEAPEDEDLFG